MRIAAIRPEPGLAATVEAGRDLGLTIEPIALAEIVGVEAPVPDGPFDVLLIGSANAVRFGGAPLDSHRDVPVHAVGEATAAEARAAGLTVAEVGSGGLQTLVDAIAADAPCTRMLRLAGEKRVALAAPPTMRIVTSVVYRVVYRAISEAFAAELSGGALVLLHSGEAARHFADECDRSGIARGRIALAALAPRIAEAAGAGWLAVESAARPVDTALLALARDMCHSLGPGH